MIKEIEKLSKKQIQDVTQIYVYAYSLVKNWIKNRKQLKLDQNVESLYNLLHTILNCSFKHYKS